MNNIKLGNTDLNLLNLIGSNKKLVDSSQSFSKNFLKKKIEIKKDDFKQSKIEVKKNGNNDFNQLKEIKEGKFKKDLFGKKGIDTKDKEDVDQKSGNDNLKLNEVQKNEKMSEIEKNNKKNVNDELNGQVKEEDNQAKDAIIINQDVNASDILNGLISKKLQDENVLDGKFSSMNMLDKNNKGIGIVGQTTNADLDEEGQLDKLIENPEESLIQNLMKLDIQTQNKRTKGVDNTLKEDFSKETEVTVLNAEVDSSNNQNKDILNLEKLLMKMNEKNENVNKIDKSIQKDSSNNFNLDSYNIKSIKYESGIGSKLNHDFKGSMSQIIKDKIDVISQIANKKAMEQLKNNGTIEIKLEPESLGKMTVRVITENGILSASIMTDNERSKALIESNMQQLKESMINQGINITSIDVNISDSQENLKRHMNFMDSKNNRNKSIEKIEEDLVEDNELYGLENNLNYMV